MKLSELQNLDPKNIGSWPLPVKFAIMIVLFVGVQIAGFYFDIQDQRVTLEQERKKEVANFQTIEEKQKKAANLEPLKMQMKEMQQSFGDMLKQLPGKTEVAALLVDISQTGLATGLEFKLFKPGSEARSEFYAQLPIQITVTGDYHQFGEFISGIAALPRIVTTNSISITPSGGAKGVKGQVPTLTMNATAMTYRALDEEEYAADKAKASKPKQGGKKK